MTMVVDNQHRPYGGLSYESMYTHQPQFTDPWSPPTTTQHSSHLYPTTLGSTMSGLTSHLKQDPPRQTNLQIPYSSSMAVSNPLTTSSYSSAGYDSGLLSIPQDGLARSSYGSENSYSSSPATHSYTSSVSSYNPLAYSQSLRAQQTQQQVGQRKLSSNSSSSRTSDPTFGDAIDAGQGMIAMSQTDLTPRNIYAPRSHRGSTDAYGFPSTHSSHSSISSNSPYPYFAASVAGSVDSSVTDYSSAASDYEPMQSRTLPRPSSLLGPNMPPAPQSMMGQFSSKMSSNTQKKHKCKVCEKRFTRPSSLQTHMYSHTGEKPFACDVEGCGRHFSVVSNLRRHKKVHKGERDHSSGEE